jgi:hypothetical protein
MPCWDDKISAKNVHALKIGCNLPIDYDSSMSSRRIDKTPRDRMDRANSSNSETPVRQHFLPTRGSDDLTMSSHPDRCYQNMANRVAKTLAMLVPAFDSSGME